MNIKVINKIKELCKLKSETTINDTILMYSEENNRIDFGRVVEIIPVNGLFEITILFFQLPFKRVRFRLTLDCLNGKDIFSFDGHISFIAAIDFEGMLLPEKKKETKLKLVKG